MLFGKLVRWPDLPAAAVRTARDASSSASVVPGGDIPMHPSSMVETKSSPILR